MKNNKITATGINKQNGKRWYYNEDRTWKVTLNDDGTALAINRSVDVYKVVAGKAYELRSKLDITKGYYGENYIIPLVESARKAEAQLEAEAQSEARAEAEAKHDAFTYHVIFDADDVDEHDDIIPAAQAGRYLAREVKTGGLNSYRDIVGLLRSSYGAWGARPVALMRLRDGAELGWDNKGLATIK